MLLNSSSFLGLRTMGSQQFGKLDESKVFTTGGIQPSMENIAIEERNLRINDVPENEEEKKLSKIEDLYQLKTQDMCIEIEYAKNGKSFNECMLNILKAKL